MDFIKNLHISDIAGDKNHNHTYTTPAPPPPTAIGASHPQSDHINNTNNNNKGGASIFDKIGDALNSHVEHKTTTQAPIAPAAAAHKEENILHKLGDVLAGSKTQTAPAPAPVPVAAPAPHKEENLLSKLGDALSGAKPPAPAPVPVAAAATHKDENILHKLGDALSGRKTPPPPPPPVHHPTNIVDKLTEVVTGKKADHEPPKPQSFVEQLSGVVLKKDESKVVQKPHGLVDKVNSALGGGSKAEAEEGRLDKAIDMFQEHVLKQGPQNNESALEQAKDKEIANMIRAAVGREKK